MRPSLWWKDDAVCCIKGTHKMTPFSHVHPQTTSCWSFLKGPFRKCLLEPKFFFSKIKLNTFCHTSNEFTFLQKLTEYFEYADFARSFLLYIYISSSHKIWRLLPPPFLLPKPPFRLFTIHRIWVLLHI